MDDFGHFPTIVRKLYSLLIQDLQRNPFESMKVLALWIWLEHTCLFSDVIRKIASFTQDFINQLADEAVTCLKCIDDTEYLLSRNMGPPLHEEYLIKRVSQLGLEGDMKGHNISGEELTMFVTFSKDYPVTELEIREFIAPVFGEYIEYIRMQEVKSNEQALYAQIVFSIQGIIEFILQNESKAKFIINGKEVWMQKFVPENGNSSFP
uniref:Uncharacterized protein n=2 Tax=Solanum lycopersicum TaxID=4081 RepID=K4DEG9_SOLLC